MASLITITEGTLATVVGTFEDEAGEPTDPTTITLKFSQGATGFTVNAWAYQGAGSISRSSTGVYVAELDTTGLPGSWVGQWVTTGAVQVADKFLFIVTPLPL